CSSSAAGHVCQAVAGGGQCGCGSFGDCTRTGATACTMSGATGICSVSCTINGGTSDRASGGCGPAALLCQRGNTTSNCGGPMSVCSSCSGSTPACTPLHTCGCVQATDCPMGQACINGACATSGIATVCNGGCYSAASKECKPGNAATA